MRITGGECGGRVIRVPKGDRVRPTQDRVREALFSMLASEVPGSRFLDLYAGSAAVGLEALSRGAADVVWIEQDRLVCRVAQANIDLLDKTGRKVICAEVERWVRGPGRGMGFDLVFADPPYAQTRLVGLASLAAELRRAEVVRPGGVFVAEQPATGVAAVWPGWRVLRDRAYGKARLVLCQRES